MVLLFLFGTSVRLTGFAIQNLVDLRNNLSYTLTYGHRYRELIPRANLDGRDAHQKIHILKWVNSTL